MKTVKPNPYFSGATLQKPLSLAFAVIAAFTPSLGFSEEDDIEGDVFELSPFTIQPEEGWVATETLAGSRLRTDFKDVAAQVEVMTMEFMDDFGITSMEESLIYSLNVSNPEDRVAGNGEGFGTSPLDFQQIRGVGGGTRSRNFFGVVTPTENYNISRLTIASGPQSILFGVGAPAGVLDVSINRAETSEDFGEVSFQTDSNGGHRVSFDYNKVIIEDKLALRMALLNKNTEQDWEPNYDKVKGLYATVTWRPFETTTIMGHYERQERAWNRANRFLPYDRLSAWYGWGQPAFDINTLPTNNAGEPLFNNLPIIYNRAGADATIVINPDGTWQQPTTAFRNSVEIVPPTDLPGVSPVNFEADNWTLLDNSIFPAAEQVNLNGLATTTEMESDIYNLFIEQRLAENWFIELGYQKEDVYRLDYDMGVSDRTLFVDPNRYLGDGTTTNPNFGDFYLDGQPQWQPVEDNTESWRATMSYEFDFADKFTSAMRVFGRHRMAILKSQDKAVNGLGQQGLRYRIAPDYNTLEEPFFGNSTYADATANNWLSNGARGINARYYLTEENGYYSAPSNLVFDGRPLSFQDENGQSFTIDPLNTGYFDEHGQRLVSNNGPQGINSQLDTEQFGYQGFFLDGRIALTYGYRKDEAKSRNFINVDQDNVGSFRHPNGARATGLFPYYEDVEFGDFGDVQSGITRTTGAVVRVFPWISLFYNKSDTFQPNIGRFDPYGNEYPGAEGEGKDIGFRLDLLDDKLVLKYNRFDLVAGPSRAANTPFNRWRDPVWDVENRYRTLTGDTNYPGKDQGGFRERGRANYWVMSDNLSEGDEVTATYAPIEGLNIRLTYTNRTAIESNIGQVWFDWIDERLENAWTKFNVPEGGADNPRDINQNGVIDTWTWDTAYYNDNNGGSQTLAEYYNDVTVNGPIGATLIKALDGKPNEFDRSESANLNVNYRFQEGRLKGYNAGFAVRYRGAPAVGFLETEVNGEIAPDLDNILAGAVDMTYDASFGYRGKMKFFGDRNFRAQFNVRNLFDDGPTFPVIKSVDGNNIRIARKSGRLFILSMDIDL